MFIIGIIWWVFLVLIILGIAIIVEVENEKPLKGLLWLCAMAIVVHFSGTVDIVNFFKGFPYYYIGYYLLIGAAWCIVKWWFYTAEWARNQAELIQKTRKEFLSKMSLDGDSIPAEHKSAWELWRIQKRTEDEFVWSGIYSRLKSPPSTETFSSETEISVRENWNRLILWCMYWPFSMVWTLIDDPIKRICQFIVVNVIGGILEFVSKQAINKINKELNK